MLILAGLPLLAWWVGGRQFWSRSRAASEPDLYRELVRRHALRPAEAAQVEGAVTWGRELQDPRLRVAVVDWATSLQAGARARAARRPWVGRVMLLVWLVIAIGGLVRIAADQDWGQLAVILFWPVVLSVPLTRAVNGPRRAIRLNSGPASSGSVPQR